MSPVDEIFLRDWSITRRRGVWRYVLVRSLAMGVAFGGLTLLILWLRGHALGVMRLLDIVGLGELMMVLGVLVVLNLSDWWRHQKRYSQIVAEREAKAFD